MLLIQIWLLEAVAAKVADYVVVGGGTAGCALAARLCECLPDSTVVLLERGPPRTPDQVCQPSTRPCLFGYA